MLTIAAVVAIVIAGVIGYTRWKDGQVETLPADQVIVAVVDGQETEIRPYSACQLDDPECQPSEPTVLKVGDADEIELRVPEDVYDHDWSVLRIYDDPGANADDYYKSYEVESVTIPVTSEKKAEDGSSPTLAVVEVHSMLVGLDDEGEQAPIATVWSIGIER
ncbi:MAG TPA: DUF2771 domain-containing protein [Candidatus Corynebacterium gallistercoris]|uniref:DUF2771 domain-containing protein n=1 Tax=Candidatus Corynebacterium gallistercoris TaxID=2838530 RepID=A0A9D1RZ64_9CORY|nr:DUF2771 domain-containing protein [Candidatus Corynebacterium gallistercoris]